jgi:hypothetical protein
MLEDVPITSYPMVSSHNAGTAYLRDSLINRWARTQDVDVISQLDCGVRILKLHASIEGSHIYIRHGPTVAKKDFFEIIDEAGTWARRNPSQLVLLHMSKCTGDRCVARVHELAESMGVARVEAPACFRGASVADAWRLGQLVKGRGEDAEEDEDGDDEGNGSMLLVAEDCVEENYV